MTQKIRKNQLKEHIRDIPDFPKKGIIFKDITTLLNDKEAFQRSIDAMVEPFKNKNMSNTNSKLNPNNREINMANENDPIIDNWYSHKDKGQQ